MAKKKLQRRAARPPIVPWENFAYCAVIETTHADRDPLVHVFVDMPTPVFLIGALRALPRRSSPFELDDGFLTLQIEAKTKARVALCALDLWYTLGASMLRVEPGQCVSVATSKPARVFVRGLAYHPVTLEIDELMKDRLFRRAP
jgi:hypothetical protein